MKKPAPVNLVRAFYVLDKIIEPPAPCGRSRREGRKEKAKCFFG
jgi:hypothetical protein